MGYYGNGGNGRGGSNDDKRFFGSVQDNPITDAEASNQEARKNAIADKILNKLCETLPSNYVSKVRGPFYSHFFRALSESLAEFQIEAELISDDKMDFNLIRSDFLYQLLGRIVFPGALSLDADNPQIEGDVPLREFLAEMVKFLLEGSRKDPIQEATGFLSDAGVEIVAKSDHIGKKASGWNADNQFEFEINMMAHKETAGRYHSHHQGHHHWHRIRIDSQGNGETKGTYYNSADRMEYHVHKVENFEVQPYVDGEGNAHNHQSRQAFPEDPFALAYNINLILKALKPAHTLYEYRHLFVEGFGELFKDDHHFEHESWRYEDLRKNWRGNKSLTGAGQTSSKDRSLLVDPAQDFSHVPPHSPIVILDGLNAGTYKALEALPLPIVTDPVARAYKTTPTGLTGTATVENGDIIDMDQDFSVMVPGEQLVFLEGGNEGTYRVASLLGNGGGPLNDMKKGVCHRIRLAHSVLRIRPRMTHTVYKQNYRAGLDRLGQSEPQGITGEDVTEQFLL